MSSSKNSVQITSNFNSDTASDDFTPFDTKYEIEELIEKLTLAVIWNDQGWGNQKGCLLLSVIDENGDQVDWEGPEIAPHNSSTSNMEVPKEIVDVCTEGKTIQISYRVGGGGGHSLYISSLSLEIQSISKRMAKIQKSRENSSNEIIMHDFGDNLDLDFATLATLTKMMEDKIKQRQQSLTFQHQSLSIHIPKIAAWKNKVKLDVGGQIFSTTVETLQKYDSLLSKLFTEENDIEIDPEDGSFIIDRNPEYFPFVLEFLRDGAIASLAKMKKDEKELVLEEAKYYSLNEMVNELQTVKKEKEKKKLTCPAKHTLTKFNTPNYGYGCDVCTGRNGYRTNIESGAVMYGCRTCNWDACESCYNGKVPTSTLFETSDDFDDFGLFD